MNWSGDLPEEKVWSMDHALSCSVRETRVFLWVLRPKAIRDAGIWALNTEYEAMIKA